MDRSSLEVSPTPYPGGDPSHLGRGSERCGLVKLVMEMQTAVAGCASGNAPFVFKLPVTALSTVRNAPRDLHRSDPQAALYIYAKCKHFLRF